MAALADQNPSNAAKPQERQLKRKHHVNIEMMFQARLRITAILALVLVTTSSLVAISHSQAVAQSTESRMTLTQGYMALSFNGKSGTLPLDFVAEMDYAIDSVYVWDATSQSWDAWTASKGPQGLNSLNRGDAMLVYVPVSKQVTFRPADLLSPHIGEAVSLPSGYSFHMFGGSSPKPLTEFLGYQAASIPVVFRWHNDGQRWSYFLPGRQPLSRMSIPWFDILNPGDPFFIYNASSTAIDLALGLEPEFTPGTSSTEVSTTTSLPASSGVSTPSRRGSGTSTSNSSAGLDLGLVERYIFEMTNEIRKEIGVRELLRDSDVDALARAHSIDMVERDFDSHTNPDGLDPTARAEVAGYPCSIGEGIFSGVTTWNSSQNSFHDEESLARYIVDGFVNSSNRRIVLHTRFDRMGVGVYLGLLDSGQEAVWTTVNYSGCHSRRLGSANLDLGLVERYIFMITNEVRSENSVRELRRDSDVDAIARAHSSDLVERDFWQQDNPHINPDGLDPTARAKAAGYSCGVGENISHSVTTWSSSLNGFHDEESLARYIVDRFMSSPGHRRNKLDSRYDRMGVGVHQARLPSGWEAVWTTENYTGARFCT